MPSVGGRGTGVGGLQQTGGTGGLVEPSAPPFCEPDLGRVEALDLWASEDQVYLFVASPTAGRKLFAKTAEGWEEEFSGFYIELLHHIAGFGHDVWFEYGGGSCSIRELSGGSSACSGAVPDATKVMITSARHAYAAYDRYVLEFDGFEWTELAKVGQSLPILDFDIFRQRMVLTNGAQLTELGLETGRVARQVASEHPVTAVAIPSDDQVLAGTDGGVVFRDPLGAAKALGSDSCKARIEQFSHADGAVFVRTQSEVLRVDRTTLKVIRAEGCDSETEVAALHARGANDVFWATVGPERGGCGAVTVYRSNGHAVQRW